jgi:uncharacterized protein (DUF488 family)
MKEQSGVLYTLGTSNRSLDEFFSLLERYAITEIVDVRRFPKSNRFPHFNKESLASSANKRNVCYHWLGELLGGYRSGGYESYKKEIAYTKGLEEVESLARNVLCVLICAERLPWKCHRFQISQSLRDRHWNVVHIIDQDRTWQPKEVGD